ncbi:probable palmitoyltransferase ZDHHC24 [Toxorhynchites rutilus septentrionalis]|uniref:probable palmitoyltransferase ZDHHC24 n=1 Tax=Toxorhynchites rutilus septentrionalis TaxID=329112 RepID=UPI00247A4CEE|nr:probable palmitoyltransferase ZDHHC24 [Toxorhynchites rutilus septentrionalis]
MKIRRRFLPRTIQDAVATAFMAAIIPITFWFEVYVVIPDIHGADSIYNWIHLMPALFLLFNISANMLATVMCDTSCQNEIVQAPANVVISAGGSSISWRLCSTCEAVAPPRSWHCNTCGVCVLKRDHHCVFTGCCIGHKNHRYFIVFLLYLFIATTYASILNNYFMWFVRGEEFRNWTSLLKIVFPLAMLVIDTSTKQYYLVIYLINMVGMCFTGVLLVYHGKLILSGRVVHERNCRDYDLGPMENLRMVLGKRWHLTWLSPFILSELPHNGINWDSIQQEASKSK